jgi:hypothetical protein
MPTESSVFHSNIEPRQIYAIDILGSWELHQAISVLADVV